MVVRMPEELVNSFPAIFETLDDPTEKQRLNISEYNVRISTLEEVFNEIGKQEEMIENEQNKQELGDTVKDEEEDFVSDGTIYKFRKMSA